MFKILKWGTALGALLLLSVPLYAGEAQPGRSRGFSGFADWDGRNAAYQQPKQAAPAPLRFDDRARVAPRPQPSASMFSRFDTISRGGRFTDSCRGSTSWRDQGGRGSRGSAFTSSRLGRDGFAGWRDGQRRAGPSRGSFLNQRRGFVSRGFGRGGFCNWRGGFGSRNFDWRGPQNRRPAPDRRFDNRTPNAPRPGQREPNRQQPATPSRNSDIERRLDSLARDLEALRRQIRR